MSTDPSKILSELSDDELEELREHCKKVIIETYLNSDDELRKELERRIHKDDIKFIKENANQFQKEYARDPKGTGPEEEEVLDDFNKNLKKKLKNEHLELEVRFRNQNKQSFEEKKHLFYLQEGTLERSVNFITDKGEVLRRVFEDSTKFKDDVYTKIILKSFLKTDGTFYVLSKEKKTKDLKGLFNLCRFKYRISFPSNPEGWRYDFTLTKTLKGSEIKKDYQKVLKDFLEGSFSPDAYEVEVEYIGGTEIKSFPTFFSPKEKNSLNLISKILGKSGSVKNIGNKAVTLTLERYLLLHRQFKEENWFMTDKADGIRGFSILTADGITFVSDVETKIGTGRAKGFEAVLDCEFIRSSKILVFDIISFNGENISQRPFSERLQILQGLKLPEPLELKNYLPVKLETFSSDLDSLLKEKDYPQDGIIFTSGSSGYYETENYKWKPLNKLSIDFLALKIPLAWTIPKKGFTSYALMSGITAEQIKKLSLKNLPYRKLLNLTEPKDQKSLKAIQFCPSSCPEAYLYYHPDNLPEIDQEIVEMTIDVPCNQDASKKWIFNRIRSERKKEKDYFGNFFQFAELIYQEFLNPFTLEILKDPETVGRYFSAENPEMYFKSNAFKRNIIDEIFLKLKDSNTIIDLASGRGADLARYRKLNIKTSLFIDVDKYALNTLIRKKYDGLKSFNGSMQIFILNADLKEPERRVRRRIDSLFNIQQADNIVCNFALHYFCDSYENLRNLIDLVKNLLKVGGLFIFTVMSGFSVFQLLKKHDGHFSQIEDKQEKYSFKALYNEKSLWNTGQKILVRLPFSTELYEEPLCNIDFVVSEFQKSGFDLIDDQSFGRDFKNSDLSKADKDNVSLYHYVILKKYS